MWAWRSCLGRPRPLLLSGIRRVRHGASQLTPTAALGRDDLIGSRGYASNSNSNGEPHADANQQNRTAATKRHLYVVLDDHMDGYGIHKLDLANDDDLDAGTRCLREPPVLRVALPTVHDDTQFAAVGSSIVAISTSITTDMEWQQVGVGGVLIYDTKMAAQVVSAYLPKSLLDGCGYTAAIPAGDRLYLLESCGSERYYKYVGHGKTVFASGLHCLTAHGHRHGGDDDKFWGWRPLSRSSPWCWSGNENLLMLPFDADNIVAHAVQSLLGGATHDHEIFVSARDVNKATYKTFSFSTRTHEWTCRGDWRLPVVGHAHYDSELDAWLGLLDDGHLRLGNVTSAPQEWKDSEESLFCLDEDTAAGLRHVDVKLVPIASHEGSSEYCLMERLRPAGNDQNKCLDNGDSCLLRLTSFYLERDEDGEPVATTCRRASSYSVSRYNKYFKAQAFWM